MEVRCPMCGKGMILFTKNKDIQKNADDELYSAYECESCNILFQYPFWKPEETAGFYESNYYAHTEDSKLPRSLRILNFYMQNKFLSKLFSPFIRKKLFPYYQGILKAKKVLDVGCGKGLFLDVMKKHGIKTYGLEPSDQAKAIAIRRGHEMIDKTFFFSSQKEIKFDLITMFQVAEHLSVQEIFEENIFSKMYDLLETGGQLVIETPNYECDYAKRFKSNWRALELPRHLVIFSPKSISKILSDKGFLVNVYTRISPIDVNESFKLKYPGNKIKNSIFKFSALCKIVFFPKKNSSLLTVVAQKI
jgi:2-polyprenyl-3-methyl-5-hydroxy-6-metoxy-1,4-benzoquinol methylase